MHKLLKSLATILFAALPTMAQGYDCSVRELRPSSVEVIRDGEGRFTFENLDTATTSSSSATIIGKGPGHALGTVRMHFPDVQFPEPPNENRSVYLTVYWDVESRVSSKASVSMQASYTVDGNFWKTDNTGARPIRFNHTQPFTQMFDVKGYNQLRYNGAFKPGVFAVDFDFFLSGDASTRVVLKSVCVITPPHECGGFLGG